MTILCYHDVHPQWDSPLAIAPDDFARQCAWLARKRRVLPLEEAVKRLDSRGRLPRGQVALTFDDGLAPFYDRTFPVLRQHGLPATMFLVAATLTPQGQEVDWIDTPPPWPLRTLTLDQVRELRDAGVSFGSHSWAHHDLTTLGEQECLRDLAQARELLEDLLEAPVPFLAYPRGRNNATVRRAAARAGYRHSFTLPIGPEPVDAQGIPRVGIYRDNGLSTFRIKASRWFLPLRTGRAWPRKGAGR